MGALSLPAVNAYLVERYLPGLSEADVRAAVGRGEAACAELRAAGTEIRYRGSIFLGPEEACFCRFDSDRAEAVSEVNQRAQFAFARITPAVAIEPSSPTINPTPEGKPHVKAIVIANRHGGRTRRHRCAGAGRWGRRHRSRRRLAAHAEHRADRHDWHLPVRQRSVGAVNVVSTFSGKAPSGPNSNGPTWGLVRLNPGASIAQAAGAVQSHHGDINALDPYGSIVADNAAGVPTQTVLTPGNYAALNITGNGTPGFVTFTVTQSASPAALPNAAATQTAIEFNFRGPTVLHNGTIVRAQNGGYLVHMIIGFGVKNAATGRQVMALLRAGKDRKAQRLASHNFLALAGPISPGACSRRSSTPSRATTSRRASWIHRTGASTPRSGWSASSAS